MLPSMGSANPTPHPGRHQSSLGSSDLIPVFWTTLSSPEEPRWVSPAASVPPHLSSLPGSMLVSPFPSCSSSLAHCPRSPLQASNFAQPVPHAPRALLQGNMMTHQHSGPFCPGQGPFTREYLPGVSSKGPAYRPLGQASLCRVGQVIWCREGRRAAQSSLPAVAVVAASAVLWRWCAWDRDL